MNRKTFTIMAITAGIFFSYNINAEELSSETSAPAVQEQNNRNAPNPNKLRRPPSYRVKQNKKFNRQNKLQRSNKTFNQTNNQKS